MVIALREAFYSQTLSIYAFPHHLLLVHIWNHPHVAHIIIIGIVLSKVTDRKEKARIGRFILPLNIEHSKSSLTQGKFHIFLITHT